MLRSPSFVCLCLNDMIILMDLPLSLNHCCFVCLWGWMYLCMCVCVCGRGVCYDSISQVIGVLLKLFAYVYVCMCARVYALCVCVCVCVFSVYCTLYTTRFLSQRSTGNIAPSTVLILAFSVYVYSVLTPEKRRKLQNPCTLLRMTFAVSKTPKYTAVFNSVFAFKYLPVQEVLEITLDFMHISG